MEERRFIHYNDHDGVAIYRAKLSQLSAIFNHLEGMQSDVKDIGEDLDLDAAAYNELTNCLCSIGRVMATLIEDVEFLGKRINGTPESKDADPR